MSRALVIKGANFEDNRVAQVVFSGIPCTAVAFDSASYNVASMSTPTVPVVTKTPADTTDELILTVADASVARVSNGGLYAVGFGTTTVTATCGSATATATITVTSIEFITTKMSGRIQASSSWGDVNPIQYSTNAAYSCFSADKVTTPATPDGIVSKSTIAVIMIPEDTAKIRIESPTLSNWHTYIRYTSTDSTLHTGDNYFAKFISSAGKPVASSSDKYVEFSDMPGTADSFAFEINNNTDYTMKVIFYPEAS